MQYLPPSFFIIGERKCATSTLYRYLIEHPQVLPCSVKEPQFFSRSLWYRLLYRGRYQRLFPKVGDNSASIDWIDLDQANTLVHQKITFHAVGERIITGEASANTFAQVPPERLHRAYPNGKLILCLRHPVDRAYSHYQMLRRFANEGRRIPLTLTDFYTDFKTDIARVRDTGSGYFAGPGFYAKRLKQWASVYGMSSIFLIRTGDLAHAETRTRVLSGLCTFLDIQQFDFERLSLSKVNVSADVQTLDPDLRAELFEYYTDDIAALEAFTGRNFHWMP